MWSNFQSSSADDSFFFFYEKMFKVRLVIFITNVMVYPQFLMRIIDSWTETLMEIHTVKGLYQLNQPLLTSTDDLDLL